MENIEEKGIEFNLLNPNTYESEFLLERKMDIEKNIIIMAWFILRENMKMD